MKTWEQLTEQEQSKISYEWLQCGGEPSWRWANRDGYDSPKEYYEGKLAAEEKERKFWERQHGYKLEDNMLGAH